MVVVGGVWSDLLVMHNYCVIISECQKVTFLVDQQVFPWSFSSLLALVEVTIEKGLHWLPQATIATRFQRGVGPWSRSSAPAPMRSLSDGFP